MESEDYEHPDGHLIGLQMSPASPEAPVAPSDGLRFEVSSRELPWSHDLDPMEASGSQERSVTRNYVVCAAGQRARQELEVVQVVTGGRGHRHWLNEPSLTRHKIEDGVDVDRCDFWLRRSPTLRYSVRISTLETSSNLPSVHATSILAGSPEKKIPDIRTFVSRTTLIRGGVRCVSLSSRRPA